MSKILHGDDIISGPENGDITYVEGFTIPHKCIAVSESCKYTITRKKQEWMRNVWLQFEPYGFGTMQYAKAIWGWDCMLALAVSKMLTVKIRKKMQVEHQGHIWWDIGLGRTGATGQLGDFFTEKILSGGNRHKWKWKKKPLCSALCSIPTEFKACMKSKSGVYTVKERWAVLRSNSKIMTKQRPIPHILFGLTWSPSLDLHVGKNCWIFCWSIQRKQGDITWQASRNTLNFIGSYLQLF